MVTILISAAFRGAVLIRKEVLIGGKCLFQYGYPKVQHFLEGSTYLRPGAYWRKCGIGQCFVRPSLKQSNFPNEAT